MFKIISGKEAVSKIGSGSSVCFIGNLNLLEPETVLYELEQSYINSGSPRELTVMFPVFLGSQEGRGADYFCHEGMVKRVIGGSFASMLPNRKLNEFIAENRLEAYNLPMGTFYNLLKATGAGQPGILTGVGLNTQIDPRQNGGSLNGAPKDALAEVMKIDGKEWLYFRRLKVDVAVIRGTSVDERGNISLESEPTSQGILATAMAAKNNGGIVIAQVRRKIKSGSVHPRLVMVPGRLVDYVVIDERDEAQVSCHPGSVLGAFRQPVEQAEPLPLDHRKVILRRILMELNKGDLVNLGFGIPAGLPSVVVEENLLESVTFSIEHGSIGGVPGWTGVFGVAMNPDVVLDSTEAFDLYTGGMLDITCLGMGEVDRNGNVNNHKFKHIVSGTGGFNEIVHATKKIVLAGTFTVGGLKTAVSEGKISVIQEGKNKKFNACIEGITLNAAAARKNGQRILFVTERAVLEAGENGLVLKEIAPGIDLEKDILGVLDFEIEIAEDLKEMDPRIFTAGLMGYELPERQLRS
jgi:propionate CoA-transferase